MDFRELYAFISILGVFVVVGGQFLLVRHQLQQVLKELEELRSLLDREREERHRLEKEVLKTFVTKGDFALQLSQLEARVRKEDKNAG